MKEADVVKIVDELVARIRELENALKRELSRS